MTYSPNRQGTLPAWDECINEVNTPPVEKEIRPRKMLVSKEKNLYSDIDTNKVSTGSYYTREENWLTAPVQKFIAHYAEKGFECLDPFAGEGHILDLISKKFNMACHGLDISGQQWPLNDSLENIPNPSNAIICTNPPYLASYSAKRKNVWDLVGSYYKNKYIDLYELAIDKGLEVAPAGVYIIPETFLHSKFNKKNLKLACVITNNPFSDTDTPICVACFDSNESRGNTEAKIYLENSYICKLEDLKKDRSHTNKANRAVEFNNANGRIALKAIDGVNANDKIRFCHSQDFYYPREKIKHSSRLITYIEIPSLRDEHIPSLLEDLNAELAKIRQKTYDLILSPFKGNNKSGVRRRRLDYRLAKQLILRALESYDCEQFRSF